jgi:hypothetical protein
MFGDVKECGVVFQVIHFQLTHFSVDPAALIPGRVCQWPFGPCSQETVDERGRYHCHNIMCDPTGCGIVKNVQEV